MDINKMTDEELADWLEKYFVNVSSGKSWLNLAQFIHYWTRDSLKEQQRGEMDKLMLSQRLTQKEG